MDCLVSQYYYCSALLAELFPTTAPDGLSITVSLRLKNLSVDELGPPLGCFFFGIIITGGTFLATRFLLNWSGAP